jgi:hypothetical protein
MTIQELLKRFAAAPSELEAKLRGLDEEGLRFRPFADAWTVHEQVVHMADAEINGSVRLRKILAESGVAVDVMDQDRWFAGLDYHSQSLDRSVRLFRLLRESAADLLSRARERMWEGNWIRHPERGKLTLRAWLELYVEHSDTHLGYIERNLRLWREKASASK